MTTDHAHRRMLAPWGIMPQTGIQLNPGAEDLELNDEITDLDDLVKPLVQELAPALPQAPGIGVEVAGQLLVTDGDNPDRLRNEASFAILCGAAPLPASSGKTQRHRRDSGGDRAANSALHLAILVRIRTEQRTPA